MEEKCRKENGRHAGPSGNIWHVIVSERMQSDGRNTKKQCISKPEKEMETQALKALWLPYQNNRKKTILKSVTA